jgi:hypothetical protein
VSHAVAVVSHHEQYARHAPNLIVLCHMNDNLDQVVEFSQFRLSESPLVPQAVSRRFLQLFICYLSPDVCCAAMRISLPPPIKTPKHAVVSSPTSSRTCPRS